MTDTLMKDVICKHCKAVMGTAGKTCFYDKQGRATKMLKCECSRTRRFK